MSDHPNAKENTGSASKAATSAAKSGVALLTPLLSVLARRIATDYAGNNEGHANLDRFALQIAVALALVLFYLLLRS